MAPAAPPPPRRARRPYLGFRRLVADERGVTMIEFGILAIPFFAIIVAILETSFVFLAGQILDSAVNDTTRLIKTGIAQNGAIGLSGYRTKLCDRLYGLFSCDQLKIKVSTVSSFTTANTTPPISSTPGHEGEWSVTEAYAAGGGSDIVLVEVYYKWPILVNFAGFNLDDVGDGTRLLASVRLFRNEPF